MADYVTRSPAPTGGIYHTPLGGVMYAEATDLSDGVDGYWTVAQFDAYGNLRVISTAGLSNGSTVEAQRVAGAGSGAALVADMTVQTLLKGILWELVQLRIMQLEGARGIPVDYTPPLYDTFDF